MITHRVWIATVIFALVEPVGLASAARLLQGQVLENHDGTTRPAANAQVWIVNVGNPYTTQDDGGYHVLVPDEIRVHQEITLFVKRKGWFIATPVGGKLELPASFNADILLSPESSPEFLSPMQLAKLVQSLPEKLQSQVKADGKSGDSDPLQVVKEYAEEHHLSEKETIVKVDALITQYERSQDLAKRCRAATYRKNLDQAATMCRAAATSKTDLLKQKRQEVENLSKSLQRGGFKPEGQSLFSGVSEFSVRLVTGRLTPAQLIADSRAPARLEEARRQLIKLTEEVVGEFRSAGDTYYANYQFDEALKAYQEGLGYVEKKDLPTIWADMQWLIGLANWQIGIRTRGDAIAEHLTEAVNRYREAQTVYTRTEFPEAWAAIQNNLGTVLSDQGRRAEGKESLRLLAEAEAAYRAALTVYTKAQLPQDWAGTQMGLGNVLSDQGRRAEGKESLRLLAEAEAAYRAALTVRTKDTLPQDWAGTQMNLGTVLSDQGRRAEGKESLRLLAEAEAAYRAALTVYTKAQLPQDWARTQMNLGTVLSDQGARMRGESGTRHFSQAVEAFYAALMVYTRAELPQAWAATASNLTEALFLSDQFGKTSVQLGELLVYDNLDSSSKVALLFISIANSIGLGERKQALHDFEKISRTLGQQGSDFFLTWEFSSIRASISQKHLFAKHRPWLLDFLSALEQGRRDEMLAATEIAHKAFLKISAP